MKAEDDFLDSWRRNRSYVITTNPDLPFTMRSVKQLIPMPIAWRSNHLVAVTLIYEHTMKFDNNFVLNSLRTTVLHRKIISFRHRLLFLFDIYDLPGIFMFYIAPFLCIIPEQVKIVIRFCTLDVGTHQTIDQVFNSSKYKYWCF